MKCKQTFSSNHGFDAAKMIQFIVVCGILQTFSSNNGCDMVKMI